ncbi:hypothetical protein ACOME3_009311 [Neoechinorhynchus agilis]
MQHSQSDPKINSGYSVAHAHYSNFGLGRHYYFKHPSLLESGTHHGSRLLHIFQHNNFANIAGLTYHWILLTERRNVFIKGDILRFPLYLTKSMAIQELSMNDFNNTGNSDAQTIPLYEVCLIGIQDSNDPHLVKITWCFPLNQNDEVSRDYVNFCFPELLHGTSVKLNESSTYVFSKVFHGNNMEYGYCLRVLDQDYYLYDGILQQFQKLYRKNPLDAIAKIQSLMSHEISPIPDRQITFKIDMDHKFLYFVPPASDNYLANFEVICRNVSPDNILRIFNALLYSQSVICLSKSLSSSSRFSSGLSKLLYPFKWPFILATLLPAQWVSDCCQVPTPFIYGCVSVSREQLLVEQLPNAVPIPRRGTMRIDSIKPFLSTLTQARFSMIIRKDHIKRFRFVDYDDKLIPIIFAEAFLLFFAKVFKDLVSILSNPEVISKDYNAEMIRDMLLTNCQSNHSRRKFIKMFTSSMIFTSFLEQEDFKKSYFEKFKVRVKEYTAENLNDKKIVDFFKTVCYELEEFIKT